MNSQSQVSNYSKTPVGGGALRGSIMTDAGSTHGGSITRNSMGSIGNQKGS